MKTILALALLIFATPLFARDIQGTWMSADESSVLVLKEGGIAYGSLFGVTVTQAEGRYRVLADESGLVFQASNFVLMIEIREWAENELILSWNGQGAILERAGIEQIARAQQQHVNRLQQMRNNSRIKAMTNNLRQIASAGMQYILEEGAESVKFEQLKGEYFNEIISVNGESYEGIVISERGGEISVTDKDGITATFRY